MNLLYEHSSIRQSAKCGKRDVRAFGPVVESLYIRGTTKERSNKDVRHVLREPQVLILYW
jgi:hypothetical protein